MSDTLALSGVVKIVMPGHTIRLCEGGFLHFDGELYLSEDPLFGAISGFSLTGQEEGQAPGGSISFNTPSAEAAAELVKPGFQRSTLDIWLAEIDQRTATVIGNPPLLVSAQLDRPKIVEAKGVRRVEIEFVSTADRLMIVNEGNSLSSMAHKRLFPGELGFDNAIGMGVTDYWGVQAPPRGVSSFGGGGGGFFTFPQMAMV